MQGAEICPFLGGIMIINGIRWRIAYVSPNNANLRRYKGVYALGVTDANKQTVFINNRLSNAMRKKVLTHELVHCVCFSYGVYFDEYTEEIVADFVATYGFEIIGLVEELLCFQENKHFC